MQNIISLIFRYFLSLFPACAGVIPTPLYSLNILLPFPRMCGGDPLGVATNLTAEDFSPHVRG